MTDLIKILWITIGSLYYYKCFHQVSRSKMFDCIGSMVIWPLLLIDDAISNASKFQIKTVIQIISTFFIIFL